LRTYSYRRTDYGQTKLGINRNTERGLPIPSLRQKNIRHIPASIAVATNATKKSTIKAREFAPIWQYTPMNVLS